jgi:HAD superfamily hydrolase (TIGR01509 family)
MSHLNNTSADGQRVSPRSRPPFPVSCFIFDFDGTLIHSEQAYAEAFSYSIRLHTGRELDRSELRGFWNVPPREVMVRYSEVLVEEMIATFEEHYYANHHNLLAPYDGIPELLQSLRSMGARIGLVSMKPRKAGERELDITGLRPLLGSVVWGDDVPRPKPEPDGVLRVIEELGADRLSTVVIGDSVFDMMMGRAAGTITAAALWGGSSREALISQQPDLALESPGELLEGRHLSVVSSRR